MKIGVITDIHNNLVALKVVIARLQQMKCDKIICCGDIIGIGPYPEETVQYMMQIPNLIAVRGNHERYLLDGMPEHMNEGEKEYHRWEHSLLSQKSVEFLRKLPYRVDVECEGYNLTVEHYCMGNEGHYINYKANPSEEDLKQMFEEVRSDIVLYGHNHFRNVCEADKWYINVGSLGCPAKDKNIARAGVLKIEEGNVEVETIDIEYDVNVVISEIDRLNYPEADTIKKIFYGI